MKLQTPRFARGDKRATITRCVAALVLTVASSCKRHEDASTLRTDTGIAGGDVSLDSATVATVFHGVKYPLTSDNYLKWLVAQGALDSLPEPSDMPRIELRDPTDDDIERSVVFLSSRDDMRSAIERSGMGVKDFVLTSIALGQAYNFSQDELVPRENRAFVGSNRAEVTRARRGRNFHVLDDDDQDDGDGRGHKHKHKHKR